MHTAAEAPTIAATTTIDAPARTPIPGTALSGVLAVALFELLAPAVSELLALAPATSVLEPVSLEPCAIGTPNASFFSMS
jgi:hypothetical protein